MMRMSGGLEAEKDEVEIQPLSDPFSHSQSMKYDHTVEDDFDRHVTFTSRSARKTSWTSVPSFELYTPDEEKVVLRKLDTHVVLFMSFLYMLSFLDRSSEAQRTNTIVKDLLILTDIGNAKIAGLSQDLHLRDSQFDWLLTAFYVTYILFEWMILLYNIIPPHVYISICVLFWGIVASLQSLVTSFSGLLVLRTLLGISEAAFSPGVPLFLSFFFRREELAMRAGIQVSAAPLAASFAGSLAWFITWLGRNSRLAPWRLLFIVEGFPSVIVAIIAWSFVPDSPETARFLTARQRKIAKSRLRREGNAGQLDSMAGSHPRFDWNEVLGTIRDPKCYLTALMFLNCNIAFSSMPVFLPTVINEMGYSALSSQALSAPPYLIAFVVVLLTAKFSDHLRARGPFVCLHAALGFLGYSLIAIGGVFRWPNSVRYLCVYPAASGFFSAVTIIITWTMNNQQSNLKKGTGMTILNLVGQCGPLLGTRLYPGSDGPYYIRGMSVCAAAMLSVFILSLILRSVLVRENRRMALATKQQDDVDEVELLTTGNQTRHQPFILIL